MEEERLTPARMHQDTAAILHTGILSSNKLKAAIVGIGAEDVDGKAKIPPTEDTEADAAKVLSASAGVPPVELSLRAQGPLPEACCPRPS